MYKNLRRKSDGTFLIDFNGFSFHVTKDYPEENLYGYKYTYSAIKEYAENNKDKVVDLVSTDDTNKKIPTKIEILIKEEKVQEIMPYIYSGINLDENKSKLSKLLLEIEELKSKENIY